MDPGFTFKHIDVGWLFNIVVRNIRQMLNRNPGIQGKARSHEYSPGNNHTYGMAFSSIKPDDKG